MTAIYALPNVVNNPNTESSSNILLHFLHDFYLHGLEVYRIFTEQSTCPARLL